MEQAYYQPTYVPGKEQTMGGAPQAIGYPPDQQQFVHAIGYNNGYQPQGEGYTAPSTTTSSGVKRSTCLALLAATLILLAAVIGLGAGLGVSQRDLHNTQADLARATGSPSAASTVFVTTTYTATRSPTSATSSSASASATVDTSNIICPKSNNTLYTAETDSSKQFREYCGIDYSGDGTQDVGSVKVTSMEACMDACAKQSNCTGASWGYLNGDNGAEHTCWMKGNLKKSHVADSGWAFGMLLTG
ncbi:hypothetical protein VMCG_03913 [Cytospora schulzeri]|uniref:Apple domain-containing protein n=1 Tax=Cytospora schulzeri TaxID=448051 RepID=A0A423WV28_9PEZI|nr:hypothetical protein VMCG_03913 [Valsa malicola]